MYIELYVKYDDIEKYNSGQGITATDKDGASVVLKTNKSNICKVFVNVTDILGKDDYVSTGFTNGTFNDFTIQKSN